MNVRFTVKDAEDNVLEVSDWMEEHSRDVAVSAVQDLRKLHGEKARISIERRGVVENLNPTQVRFRIDEDDAILYSRLFPIAEREQRLAEMRQKHPDAVITEQTTR